jgi:hypothetical protein
MKSLPVRMPGYGTAVPLPSQSSADRFVREGLPAVPGLVAHTLLRSTLVAGGLLLFAGRRDRKVIRDAVAGAMMIEVFVLSWAWWHREGAT